MTRPPVTPAVAISAEAFAPFGDLLEVTEGPFKTINQGRCRRYDDLARIDIRDGRAGFSLFQSEVQRPPFAFEMLERHPLGSQCFIPMLGGAYLVAVAPDTGGAPGPVSAFVVGGDQAVNIHRNVWHGVLTPIEGQGLFAVIDRIGVGKNLEEHWFGSPLIVEPVQGCWPTGA